MGEINAFARPPLSPQIPCLPKPNGLITSRLRWIGVWLQRASSHVDQRRPPRGAAPLLAVPRCLAAKSRLSPPGGVAGRAPGPVERPVPGAGLVVGVAGRSAPPPRPPPAPGLGVQLPPDR